MSGKWMGASCRSILLWYWTKLKFLAGMYLLASILCLAFGSSLGSIMEGNYNVTAMCTTVKVGTQLGSIESCDYYYVCTQNGPVKSYCQTGYSYNYKAQTCSPSSQVKCYYGVADPCEGSTGDLWVPAPNTCNQWIYCKNGVASGSGTCGDLTFSASLQQCIYGDCNVLEESGGPSLNSLCEVVPPNMYFGSVSNCTTYNYCYPDGSLGSGTCTTSVSWYLNTSLIGNGLIHIYIYILSYRSRLIPSICLPVRFRLCFGNFR